MGASHKHPVPALELGLRRGVTWIARWEPLLVLALAPLFIFPRPGLTPWLMIAVPLLWVCRWLARGRLTGKSQKASNREAVGNRLAVGMNGETGDFGAAAPARAKLALASSLRKLRRKAPGSFTLRTPLDWPLVIIAGMLLVSLWATYDPLLSFFKVCGVFFGIALFYAIVNGVRTERGVWLAVALLLAGGAAIAGVGLLGTSWSMRKVPLLALLLDSYRQLPALLRGVPRAEEGFNPNQVGGTLVLFIPLAAVLLIHRLRRPRREVGWLLSTLGLAGALALTSCVLLLTQSRMAYFSAALGLLLLGLFRGRRLRVLTVLVLLLVAGSVAILGPEYVLQAMFGFRTQETMSSTVSWASRVEIWQRALRVIRDHPLTGIGFDTLFPVIHARYPTFLLPAGRGVAHAHNVYLQIALDLGLPGLVAFLWLFIALVRMLWQVWRGAASPGQRAVALGLLLGLVAQLTFGLADAIALGQKPGVFLWAYLGLGAALWRMWAGEPERAERRVQAIHPISFVRSLLTTHYRPVILVLVLVVVLGWGYRTLWRARIWLALIESDVAAMQALAQEGPQAIAPQRPDELLRQTGADLRGFQAEFALPVALASHLGWVPRYGADLEAVPALLQIGLILTDAGERALEPLDPLLSAQQGGDGAAGNMPEMVVRALDEGQPGLLQLLAAVEEAQEIRQTMIDAEHLSPRLAGWVAQLDKVLPPLESGVRGALALPELLGTSEPRTYLILIQNEDELRPTGGFISGVARVTVREGQVVELIFEDSYAVDDFSQPYPDPPLPLREIMGADLWVFRDSNWSPDFPTSARAAVELYQLRDDAPIDGVLALDQQAVRLLVTALGPLKVEEYPEPVTGENVIQAIRESWAPSPDEGFTGEWWRHRKDFIGRLFTATVAKAQDESTEINLPGLGWAVLQALEERHLFIYLSDAGPASDALHEAGWDGALRESPGDYLMVVDANLGFNKANPYIAEALSYTVDLQDLDHPQAELVIEHWHAAAAKAAACDHTTRYDLTYEQMMYRCYWDYVRVYVPEGSRLLEATRHPVPGELLVTGVGRTGDVEVLPGEPGKSAFATFLVLPPGEQVETRFAYDLSPGVIEQQGDAWRYSLYVQKQGGTDGHAVHVTLILPPAAEVISSDPTPIEQVGNTLLYELSLQTDLELEVRLQVP